MDNRYWNGVADRYEQEIFNVYANDSQGVLEKMVGKVARDRSRTSLQSLALDVGCGIGNGVSLLCRNFDTVIGLDKSSSNIARCHRRFGLTQTRTSGLAARQELALSFFRWDLAQRLPRRPAASLLLCTSVLIMPSLTTRLQILDTLTNALLPGAYLLLVVPSLESNHLIDLKTLQWNLSLGVAPQQAGRAGFDKEPAISQADFRQGIVPLHGVRTKHYQREELDWLGSPALEVCAVEKVRYAWSNVFTSLPASLSDPEPWDWALLLRKPA